MKKKIVVLIVIILSMCFFATACVEPKIIDSNKGAITIEINNIDDFLNINSKLGKDYDKATFLLKSDLDFANVTDYVALGDSYDNSFRSTFDGNGFKISNLNVKNGSGYYGLFGYTVNAKFKNIKIINNTLDIAVKEKDNYIGGVVAFGAERTEIENVEVSTFIKVSLDYKTIEDENDVEYEYSEFQYIGGIIGYNSGLLTVKNCNANTKINNQHPEASDDAGDEVPKVNIKNLIAGGAIGYANGTYDQNIIENVKADVYFNLCAEKANVGGLIGYSDNSKITNCNVISGDRFYLMSLFRANIGGLVGTASNTEVTTADISITLIKVNKDNSNIGGLIGYADKGSKIDTVNISASYNIEDNMMNLTLGGVIGNMRDSTLKNVIDIKGIIKSGINEITLNSEGKKENRHIGGIVGIIFGKSNLSSAKTNLKAYQGAVGILIEDIIPGTNDEEGKTFTPTIENASVKFLLENCIAPESASIPASRLRNSYGTGLYSFE